MHAIHLDRSDALAKILFMCLLEFFEYIYACESRKSMSLYKWTHTNKKIDKNKTCTTKSIIYA